MSYCRNHRPTHRKRTAPSVGWDPVGKGHYLLAYTPKLPQTCILLKTLSTALYKRRTAERTGLMRAFPILVPALLLLVSLSAHGQTQQQDTPALPPKINLTLEQRHMVKEIIKDSKQDNVADAVQISVGEIVPKSVQLHPMPSEAGTKVSQIKAHLFFLKDGKVVVVDPRENKIVDVIE